MEFNLIRCEDDLTLYERSMHNATRDMLHSGRC